jgi:hypothetical protein
MSFSSILNAELSEILYRTLLEVASDLEEVSLPAEMSRLPPGIQEVIGATPVEAMKVQSGGSLYTHEEFEALMEKASSRGLALPVITVECINRVDAHPSNPHYRTLAYRLVEMQIRVKEAH